MDLTPARLHQQAPGLTVSAGVQWAGWQQVVQWEQLRLWACKPIFSLEVLAGYLQCSVPAAQAIRTSILSCLARLSAVTVEDVTQGLQPEASEQAAAAPPAR